MMHPETDGSDTARRAEAPDSAAAGFSPTLVAEQNAGLQSIPLAPARIDELPAELNQFFAATRRNRARLKFDVEPARFVVSLSLPARDSA